MITRATSIAQQGLSNQQGDNSGRNSQRRSHLQATAVQEFVLGVNASLLTTLAARGDDLSDLALQRRLLAYAAPPGTGAAASKLRRYV